MKGGTVIFLLLALCAVGRTLTPSTYLTVADRTRLKSIFASAWPLNDLVSSHYAVLGYSLLKEAIPNTQETCNFLKSKVDPKNLESIYHASSAAKILGNCKLSPNGAQQFLDSTIKEDSPVPDLYFAVLSQKNLGYAVDSAKVVKSLTAALKKDDSVLNLGFAFHVASQLPKDHTTFFERIEDAVVQADEVDGKYLQFEGGLGITANTVSGAYRLAEVVKKAPAISGEKAVKFTNYFLSRKFVQAIKGAAQLLEVLKIMTENKFHIPVAVTLASNGALSVKNPAVQVQVTNVLGASLGPLTVTADTATRIEDDAVIISKKPFQAVMGSDSLYSLNFLESKPLRGFYKISVNAVPVKADASLVGNTGAQVDAKVMTEVGVENVELGTVDRDQATSPKNVRVEYGKQLTSLLEADYHQKLLMKFTLKDKIAGSIMTAHQTFVQFTSKDNKQTIVFVAEPDNSNIYKFDMDIHSKAKEFNYQSGKYDIVLIVGDAVIANPFTWKIGEIMLTFPQHPNPSKPTDDSYAPKPEIKHLFREQEKRPPLVVSNTFSVLVFVPLLLLLILWFKIGANLSYFPQSLGGLGFHLGLAGIFSLFAFFWLQMNMFTTLKCLSGVGIATFLCGHSLLSKIAATKK